MEDIKRNAEKKINEGADKVRDGVERARNQGVGMMEEIFPMADEAIENAKAKGEKVWDKAKSKGLDMLDEVESTTQMALDKAKGFVQNRPLQALGYALALGILVGYLVTPKED